MRKNWVLVLFVVLGFGVHSPTANAEGFVDVHYDVVMDVTFNKGEAVIASPMSGFMTIRYDHAGTGTGTTITAGGAQLLTMIALGPAVLDVPGILSMTGPTWITMGRGDVGTWGPSIPWTDASYYSASGLNLPGLNGLLTSNANCHNGGPYWDPGSACTNSGGMPVSQNPQSNPTPFTDKTIKGYGNFNAAGPPPTLTFMKRSGVNVKTHNIATTMLGLPLAIELSALVGTETSRTYVPEPNMALLFGGAIIGLACIGSVRRRKR